MVGSSTRVYGRNGQWMSSINEHCPILKTGYKPSLMFSAGGVQSFLRAVIKSCPAMDYERELVKFSDGGQCSLDWMVEYDVHTAPLVLLIPGLTGSSAESYILHLVESARQSKCNVVVFNNRGNGNTELLTPQTYSAAYTSDLKQVVVHIRSKYPDNLLIGAGCSLGGIIMYNYISSCAVDVDKETCLTYSKFRKVCGIDVAFIVCSPWHPEESTISLERMPSRYLFNYPLARALCKSVKKNRHILGRTLDIDHVMKSRLIRHFDERFIVPMFGYKDVHEYYEDARMDTKIDSIYIPVMCLNAADDCFVPVHTLPCDAATKSNYVSLVVTDYGGHLGYLAEDTWWPSGQGFLEKLFMQFLGAARSFARNSSV